MSAATATGTPTTNPGEHLMPVLECRWPRRLLALAVCGLLAATAQAAPPLQFHLSFDAKIHPQPFTGRVYLLLSKKAISELPSGPNWFRPEPFFAQHVKSWKPGETLTLSAINTLGHPEPLGRLSRDTYTVQAVMDLNRGARSFSAAEGNLHSRPIRLPLEPGSKVPVKLMLDQVYHERRFEESEHVKLVHIPSKLLSVFHGRPVRLRAGVVLPKSFAKEPQRRYPVIYEIPGFGGTHFGAFGAAKRDATEVAGVEMLYVVLDPACRWGHHVFADSDNNGPCGRALCEELVPHIEKAYRGLGVPAARFVTGHSSGGWSSLWLQVTYPDFFGGVWSTAPDPVDFRDFQRVNLYQPGISLFFDEKGQPRPLARKGEKPVIFYKPFADMEEVMGHGGQLVSFEAVFGPRGPDGRPKALWDRQTGRIDPAVAKTWERYDIRLRLERDWPALAPKLAGKLHVYMGSQDTFYLEGATVLLKEAVARLGSDAVVELFPGRDHGTLLDRALRERIAREMADQFRRQYPKRP
jgi:pimeloyl-ACP methyl ester carboxylesterase